MFAGELAEHALPAAAYRACRRRRDKVKTAEPMAIYWSHGRGELLKKRGIHVVSNIRCMRAMDLGVVYSCRRLSLSYLQGFEDLGCGCTWCVMAHVEVEETRARQGCGR
jgi:hypothetical protein